MGHQLVRKFDWVDHEEFGWGWVPAWIENADPVTGYTAGHDVLEHFPRCIGGIEGEMMAFGAMHIVRASREQGFGRRGICAAQGDDIERFFGDLHMQGDSADLIRDPGRVNLDDAADDIDMEQLGREVRKGLVRMLDERTRDSDSTRARVLRELGPRGIDKRIVGWIAKGALKARKRFAQWDLDTYELAELYNEVEKQFNALCDSEGEPGEQITVRVDFAARRVTVDREWATRLPPRQYR